MTSKERHEAMLRVLEFARSNGFPNAALGYNDEAREWEPRWEESIRDVTIDYDHGQEIRIQVSLGFGGMERLRVLVGRCDQETSPDIIRNDDAPAAPVKREGGEA